MRTKTPQQAPAIQEECGKCGSRAKSVDYDGIGMVITCAICGKCTYMNKNNQPVEEQQELDETKTSIQKSGTPVEVVPGTAEKRQGDNLEYEERRPQERGWETAIDEAQELEQPAIDDDEELESEDATNDAEEYELEAATNEAMESGPEAATNEAMESRPEAATNEADDALRDFTRLRQVFPVESESEIMTSEAEESEPETATSEVEESEPETATSEVEESMSEDATSEAEESEPEAATSEVKESEPETATNEVEESTSEDATNEAEESEPEAATSEAEESEPEAATSEAEESEPEAATSEAEESEPEAATSEAEESEPEAATSEAEESEPETETNEAEKSTPEAETSEAEESTPETTTNEVEKSKPDAMTDEAEEPKQSAISMAGESEMQNGRCPYCGQSKNPRDIRRYERTALRQCTKCLTWEINPGQKRKPGNEALAISIALQMNFQGAGTKEIQEKIDLLTKNVRMGRNSLHYWIRRYAKPGIERARKLQVVNSSGEWELDIVSLKYRTQQHYCWSITDVRTQYILATERTSQPRIGEELFKMATHAAGQEPHTILLGDDLKKDTPGLAEQARTATLIQRRPSEENSNGSTARLRNALLKRMEAARGGFNQETMGYILGALAMSINLFEQSEQLGEQTPAEAAGVETPYQNWEDMVKKEKVIDNPAESADSSKTMPEGLDPAERVGTMPEGLDAAERVGTMPEGLDAAEPVETIAGGQDAAEPVETIAGGQDAAEPVETIAGGQGAAEPVETMTGGKDATELAETTPEEESRTIMHELEEVLNELDQRRESLVREHQQVISDRRAVKRTMEILKREQPAVNNASQETVPVA